VVFDLDHSDAPGTRFLIEDVSWELYEHLLKDLDRSHRRLRVTYDDGRMELMVLTNLHEQGKKIVARLVETYALARRIEIVGVGSVTLKKKEKRQGLEPDECYYVQTPAPAMRVMQLNLKKYPPPDLGIEVDITRSSIPRQPIYATMKVPEVWRFDGERVTVLLRQANGKYKPAARSLAFPKLPIAELNRFISMALETSQHHAVFAFWDWLQAHP
jgi:Uma2 family endonuclease